MVECGPYFQPTPLFPGASGVYDREARCISDYQRQGFERVPLTRRPPVKTNLLAVTAQRVDPLPAIAKTPPPAEAHKRRRSTSCSSRS